MLQPQLDGVSYHSIALEQVDCVFQHFYLQILTTADQAASTLILYLWDSALDFNPATKEITSRLIFGPES